MARGDWRAGLYPTRQFQKGKTMKTISQTKAGRLGRCAVNVLRLASNVADAETITIGVDVYEIDTAAAPGAITSGNIRVDCSAGVTPTIASAAIVAAINASNHHNLKAVAISVNEILIYTTSGDSSALTLACTETLAGANNAWMAATMTDGQVSTTNFLAMGKRVPTAQEVTIGNMHFVFPWTVGSAMAVVRVTATGVEKAWDGAMTISGQRVTLDNAGATDWAATDTVTVLASQ